LSDATALRELREHPRSALNDVRLTELGTLGSTAAFRLFTIHNLVCHAVASDGTGNTFYTPTAATCGELLSAISAFSRVTSGGQLYAETICEVGELSLRLAEDLPRTSLERFARALGEWKGLLAPDHFDSMMRHIDRILSDEEELQDDQVTPSLSSFDDMLAFLGGRPWDRAPAVGLNGKGQFSASWGKAHPKSDVTLTFLGEGVVKWYLYGLGRRRRGSAVGTSDRADLSAMLSRLGCDEWMIR
jgi:hypothetical protein